MKKGLLTFVSYYRLTMPPSSGAMLRTYYLMAGLSDNFAITLIDYGGHFAEEKINDSIVHITLSKKRFGFKLEYFLKWLLQDVDCPQLAVALFSKIDPCHKAVIKHAAHESIALISEFPYQFWTFPRKRKNILIYNAHNVEFMLHQRLLPETLLGKTAALFTKQLEKRACRQSDFIVTCSDEDKKTLASLYKISANKIHTLPNGTDTREIRPCEPEEKKALRLKLQPSCPGTILFIGSNYQPNVEAARFILEKLAPALPEYHFIIAGRVVESLTYSLNLTKKHVPISVPELLTCPGKIIGHGWHELENWPGDLLVRWTGKRCGLRINLPGVKKFRFKAACPKSINGIVLADRSQIGYFKTSSKWQEFTFNSPPTDNPFIELKLHKSWKPVFDFRELGISICEVGYEYEGGSKNVCLEEIKNYIFCSDINNVLLVSHLSGQDKINFLKACDLGINPMFQGSGSNLKAFEYMAAGLPVVSTRIGARGIDGQDGKHFMISSLDSFAQSIKTILQDRKLYDSIKKNARELAETKYDWRVITSQFNKLINKAIQDSAQSNP